MRLTNYQKPKDKWGKIYVSTKNQENPNYISWSKDINWFLDNIEPYSSYNPNGFYSSDPVGQVYWHLNKLFKIMMNNNFKVNYTNRWQYCYFLEEDVLKHVEEILDIKDLKEREARVYSILQNTVNDILSLKYTLNINYFNLHKSSYVVIEGRYYYCDPIVSHEQYMERTSRDLNYD